jgi:rhodanese-related sulfurtransferase
MFEILKNMFGKKDDNALAEIINDGAFLVDVRSPMEFASEKVKGSVNIPVDQIQNHLAKFKGKNNIVVFCRSGARSSQAKAILERNGITNVTNGGTWHNVATLLTK